MVEGENYIPEKPKETTEPLPIDREKG